MGEETGISRRSRFAAGVAVLAGTLILAGLPLAGKDGPSTSAPDAAYREAFEKWKQEQVDDLKKNWLTLAGLFWLKPGANSVGSDPTNAIVLPQGTAAAHAGSFELQVETVTVKFLPGVQARIGGSAASSGQLQLDVSGKPTIVELGSLRMLAIKRGQRIGIRVRDLDSAAARNYAGPVFYPLNMNFRVTAKWIASDGKKTIDVPNVLGDVIPTPVAGVAKFSIDGREVSLTDLGGDPAKGLFFVFNDLTSKTDTYPGGRFLDTDPVVNGMVVLDFNRANNPPCAVTPYATCPLAPKENRLSVAIPAGEKYDRAHGHH
jgi:uncharacterized protein (DUF1684 family)